MANLPLISLKHSGLGKGSDQLQSSVRYKDSYVAILCPSSVLNIQFYAKADIYGHFAAQNSLLYGHFVSRVYCKHSVLCKD